MKVCFLVFCSAFVLVSCAGKTAKSEATSSHIEMINGERMLIGEISKEELFQEFDVFRSNYDSYQPSQGAVTKLQNLKEPLLIELYLGTWCSDSKYNVPPFLKILDASHSSHITCNLHAVDRTKKDRNGASAKLHITQVPTMIFYRDGMEIGRIVENSYHETLEEDILEILSK